MNPHVRYILKTLAIGLNIFLITACERKKSETARISIDLPQWAEKSVSTMSIEPTLLSEVNCYYVLISGPEDFMKTTACGRTEADGSFTTGYEGGVLAGGLNKNTSPVISLDVPAGDSRNFFLFGARSTSATGCRAYGAQIYNQKIKSLVSSGAYLLGTSMNNRLVAGETKTIDITASLDADNWIEECTIIRAPTGITSGDPDAAPNLLFMDKPSAPRTHLFRNSHCEPFKITTRNKFWKNTALGSGVTVQTFLLLSEGTSAPINTYATAADCSSNPPNGATSFAMTTVTKSLIRWLKTSEISSGERLQFVPDSASLTPGYFSAIRNAFWTPVKKGPSDPAFSILAPELVQQDLCFPVVINYVLLDGTPQPIANNPYNFSSYEVGGATSKKIYSVFSDSACTEDITASTDLTYNLVYVKVHNPEGGGRAAFTVLGKNPKVNSTIHFYVLGNNVVDKLNIIGPQTLALNRCEGPFRVHLSNSSGAYATNTSATAISATVSAGTSY
ncbi:MAG: hypothetical protein IT287_05065 [Bdellovibrionaceae bacterium]|nr:hypothetical protein [Pseudobdellovibrionaceae bacterium]